MSKTEKLITNVHFSLYRRQTDVHYSDGTAETFDGDRVAEFKSRIRSMSALDDKEAYTELKALRWRLDVLGQINRFYAAKDKASSEKIAALEAEIADLRKEVDTLKPVHALEEVHQPNPLPRGMRSNIGFRIV